MRPGFCAGFDRRGRSQGLPRPPRASRRQRPDWQSRAGKKQPQILHLPALALRLLKVERYYVDRVNHGRIEARRCAPCDPLVLVIRPSISGHSLFVRRGIWFAGGSRRPRGQGRGEGRKVTHPPSRLTLCPPLFGSACKCRCVFASRSILALFFCFDFGSRPCCFRCSLPFFLLLSSISSLPVPCLPAPPPSSLIQGCSRARGLAG